MSEIPAASVIAVIPARHASQRFPGKLLAELAGQTVIARVADAATAASRVGHVLIATDHADIAREAERVGVEVVMTRVDHASGSDRIGEAMAGRDESIVLNIQGDEPLIDPQHIDELVQLLADHATAGVSTLATPATEAEREDPNVVKVVCSTSGQALYFSRSPLPGRHPDGRSSQVTPLRHVGVYGYRREVLDQFLSTPPSALEQAEGLEQLRLMSAGVTYQVGVVATSAPGIDTPEDLESCRRILAQRDLAPPDLSV